MKRLLTTFAFALAALCISACDNRRQPLFTANPLGAGPVLLTVSAARIPASHPGLYDAFTTDRTPEGETVLRFTLAGEAVMEARATKSNQSKFSDRESDRRTASRRERT